MTEKLRRADAAAYLLDKYGFGAVQTLASAAVRGDGPAFQKYGRWPVYTREALDEWAQRRISPVVRSTAELKAINA